MKKSESNRSKKACVYKVENEMTIYTAADNREKIIALLDKNTDCEIDLSDVSDFDTAGLQLLVMAKQESRKRGHEITIKGHTDAVIDVLDMCNLTAFFGDPLVMTDQA